MIRDPPELTPFPYPPLFRSTVVEPLPAVSPERVKRGGARRADLCRAGRPLRSPRRRDGATRRRGGSARPDRKSTRLNSSHANISYAVFCLKKKMHDTILIYK